LRSNAAAFRHEWKTNDQSLAEKIRADAIDVAIDLSGHTRGQSLVAFHLRPAPVQVSYLGYPNITGLDAIDARIVDSITDPVSDDDASRVSERLVRIDPCFLCFRIPSDAPPCEPEGASERDEPTWTPCGGGDVTFGSCNAIQKINASVMRTWARVLEHVPRSRLLLKATNLQESALRDDVLRRFEAAGVEAGRIEISPPVTGLAAHLAFYRRIDVALDSFPYCGTTTTCDAMLMGVPVVTLRGKVHASRVGASLATAVGCPEWIAEDEASYATIAAKLAADVRGRALLRRGLRERMRASPLCDGPGFARRFEGAIRDQWRRWCES
jgi:predicted O-linked N-acetylglucosamine transferase (SPINDLY family)